MANLFRLALVAALVYGAVYYGGSIIENAAGKLAASASVRADQ